MSIKPHDHIAAVDLGSNSFRLEIGRIESAAAGSQITRLDYLKESVRQGAGLDDKGRLSEDAMLRGIACLKRFAERLRDFKPQHVRAVATQTLREATNRDDFIARGQAVLGFPIEVISGREEARLIYSGVSRLLADNDEKRLVIDIGGRSTEVILGCGLVPTVAESYKVGSVSVSMRYFPEGKFTDAAFEQAVIAARAALEESTDLFGFNLWDTAYGSSGTAGAVAELLRANGVTDGAITRAALAWATAQLQAAGSADKLKLLGLKEDRKAVLAGGLAVITALFDTFNLSELQPAKGALRQGVMFEIVGREQDGRDLRNDSVSNLQQRFTIDSDQSIRVAQQAQNNLLQLLPDAQSNLHRELRWAAALHELGMAVSHSEYHKHGAYIIAHADAAGFSQPQQERLAALVEGHRGRVKKVEAFLSESAFAAQLLALRVAAIVCHARRAPDASGVKLKSTGAGFSISLRSAWAQAHPQTVYLLNEEVQAWRKAPFLLELLDNK